MSLAIVILLTSDHELLASNRILDPFSVAEVNLRGLVAGSTVESTLHNTSYNFLEWNALPIELKRKAPLRSIRVERQASQFDMIFKCMCVCILETASRPSHLVNGQYICRLEVSTSSSSKYKETIMV